MQQAFKGLGHALCGILARTGQVLMRVVESAMASKNIHKIEAQGRRSARGGTSTEGEGDGEDECSTQDNDELQGYSQIEAQGCRSVRGGDREAPSRRRPQSAIVENANEEDEEVDVSWGLPRH